MRSRMLVVSAIISCVSLSWGGEHHRNAPRFVVLERDLGELILNVVGLYVFLYFHEPYLLGPMGSDGAVFGTVALSCLLGDHHRLEPLADEVVGVELLVWREP